MTSLLSHKIPITAMSWNTSLGNCVPTVWEKLLKGHTGVRSVPCGSEIKNTLAGVIPDVPMSLAPNERLHRIASEAISKLLSQCDVDTATTGLIVGTSLGSQLDDEYQNDLHQWANRLAKSFNFSNRIISVSTACCSASDAIMLGSQLIRAGIIENCVCGGVDILTDSKRIGHSCLGTLSPTTLKAFDKSHDGTVLGEGSGFILLQSEGNTNPLAYICGLGSANDGAGLTSISKVGTGGKIAIERSIKDAKLNLEDIKLINAHGTGTLANDRFEAELYHAVFKNSNNSPQIFANKGAFGHSLGACGGIETIALIQALNTGVVPAIPGLTHPDNEYDLNLIFGGPKKTNAQYGLNLTLGFCGFSTSLIFEKGKADA